MTATILSTRNPAWGFFGTIGRSNAAPEINALEAWNIASRAIGLATRTGSEAVRSFLDSRQGRHFADDVATGVWAGDALQRTIDGAVNRWTAWTISKRTSRDYGIPHGLPYLTGFVLQAGILAEAD